MHTLPKYFLLPAAALAAMAGCIDAIGYMQLNGYFVSFMSGNSTRFALNLQHENWPAFGIVASILSSFITGTIFGAIVRSRVPAKKTLAVLVAVSFLLTIAALCDGLGAPTLAMLLLALAMGAENSVLQSADRSVIGVTYMTGTLVKMGHHIAAALQGGSKFSWLPYLLLWAGLITGGVTGAFLFFHCGKNALWFPTAWSWLLTGLFWRKGHLAPLLNA